MTRERVRYALAAVATIGIGLLVNRGPLPLPAALRDVLGDTLWAMMIAWWIGVLVPAAPFVRRGATAFAVCGAVELSQLIRTPALNALRRTTLGHLVLGTDFDARDLVAYAGGVLVAVMIERVVRERAAVRVL